MADKKLGRYIALVGIDWEDKRYEPGEDVSSLPPKSLKWLVDQGLVEDREAGNDGSLQ